jgi:hypothetical protein
MIVYVIVAVVVVTLAGLAMSVRVIKQYERVVLFELGKVKDSARGPGMWEALAAGELAHASDVMMAHPPALQLRNLQTLVEIAVDKNSTVVFPAAIDEHDWRAWRVPQARDRSRRRSPRPAHPVYTIERRANSVMTHTHDHLLPSEEERNAAVAIYADLRDAEDGVRALADAGFDMAHLSIIAKGMSTERHVMGFDAESVEVHVGERQPVA